MNYNPRKESKQKSSQAWFGIHASGHFQDGIFRGDTVRVRRDTGKIGELTIGNTIFIKGVLTGEIRFDKLPSGPLRFIFTVRSGSFGDPTSSSTNRDISLAAFVGIRVLSCSLACRFRTDFCVLGGACRDMSDSESTTGASCSTFSFPNTSVASLKSNSMGSDSSPSFSEEFKLPLS